ncbi:MAG: NAD(P)-binding domain-containing protein, partial [Planctomycetota bacterium]|nr:NAD(P)-binding domain-containing protein [Planctomycetota bacterium]
MARQQIGLAGLAVMGQNLVLNMESKGFSVAVLNRTGSKTKDFVEGPAAGKNIHATYDPKGCCAALQQPRKVMMMVKAGPAGDAMSEQFLPSLDEGDL